jgi:hypothetical protein
MTDIGYVVADESYYSTIFMSCSEVALNHRRSMKAECDVSGNGSTLPACLSLLDGGGSGQLTAASACCADRTATEAGPVKELHRSIAPSSSSIPPWLQHCRDQVNIPRDMRSICQSVIE